MEHSQPKAHHSHPLLVVLLLYLDASFRLVWVTAAGAGLVADVVLDELVDIFGLAVRLDGIRPVGKAVAQVVKLFRPFQFPSHVVAVVTTLWHIWGAVCCICKHKKYDIASCITFESAL